MDDNEIVRTFAGIMQALDKNTEALIRFEELVKHLTTKEETALLRGDMQTLRGDMYKIQGKLILWIIGTNVAVGGVLFGALQHWKP